MLPLLRYSSGAFDGAVSADGSVAGCYVHGLFNDASQRAAWLADWGAASDGMEHLSRVEAALDELADVLGKSLNIDRLQTIAAHPAFLAGAALLHRMNGPFSGLRCDDTSRYRYLLLET